MRQTGKFSAIIWALFIVFIMAACGQGVNEQETTAQETLQAIYMQQTEEASSEFQENVNKEDWRLPADPPEPLRTLADSVSGYSAHEKRATQGDNFDNGLYERPFSSADMRYRPDLDITEVDFAADDHFYYFTIRLFGINPDGGGLRGAYILEFDRTLSGRGDLLVWVANPRVDWTIEEVEIYGDQNRDVGGVTPVFSETGFTGSGYDLFIEMDAQKNAFARQDPVDGNALQIAVSLPLVGKDEGFAWSVLAEDWRLEPHKFDYNDQMGLTEAGSPMLGENYPLKGLYNLDNTCRLPVGLEDVNQVPGLCKVGAPKAPPKKSGCTWHCSTPGYDYNSCIAVGNSWICD